MKTPLLCCALSGLLLAALQADPVIERVMQQAFKGEASLVRKTAAGKASAEDLDELLALLRALPNGYPSQGGIVPFQQKVGRVTGLAEEIARGRHEAIPRFASATDCKACHDQHAQPPR